MKFEVLGREVDAQWGHLQVYVCAILLSAVLGFVASAMYAVLSGALQEGADFSSAILGASAILTRYFAIVGQPIAALLILWVAGFLGMKKDAALCRGIAAIDFILLGVAFFILAIIMLLSNGTFGVPTAISQTGRFFGYAIGALSLYLWLLFFIKPDSGEARKTVMPALEYSVLLFLLVEGFYFLASYQSGILPPSEGLAGYAQSLVSNFVFGFIVLYHARGKTLDEAAYLFAGLYLAQYLMFAMSNFIAGYPAPAIKYLAHSIQDAVGLGILFSLAGMKFENGKKEKGQMPQNSPGVH